MGLVFMPFMLFWLFAIGFSIRMGYVLLSGVDVFPTLLAVIGAALLLTVLYVNLCLLQFKGVKELWALKIHVFFLTNKLSFLLFLTAAGVYLFGEQYWDIEYVRSSLFVMAFTASVASIAGFFSADGFIEKYQIKTTH